MAQHTLDYKSAPKYSSYKKRALNKFPNEQCINQSEFAVLSSMECHYCGKPGPNGIDRINNCIGYVTTNCVSACKHCNYVKGDFSIEDFETWKNGFINKQTKQIP